MIPFYQSLPGASPRYSHLYVDHPIHWMTSGLNGYSTHYLEMASYSEEPSHCCGGPCIECKMDQARSTLHLLVNWVNNIVKQANIWQALPSMRTWLHQIKQWLVQLFLHSDADPYLCNTESHWCLTGPGMTGDCETTLNQWLKNPVSQWINVSPTQIIQSTYKIMLND